MSSHKPWCGLVGSLLIAAWLTSCLGDGQAAQGPDSFDVLGVRLGTPPDAVGQLHPGLIRVEHPRWKAATSPTWLRLGAVNFVADFTAPPYGSGMFKLEYTAYPGDIDRKLFLDSFKQQLVDKYGPPDYLKVNPQDYIGLIACWGQYCRQVGDRVYDAIDRRLFETLPSAKFLVVTVETLLQTRAVFRLFDTGPYHIKEQEEQRRRADEAGKKLRF